MPTPLHKDDQFFFWHDCGDGLVWQVELLQPACHAESQKRLGTVDTHFHIVKCFRSALLACCRSTAVPTE